MWWAQFNNKVHYLIQRVKFNRNTAAASDIRVLWRKEFHAWRFKQNPFLPEPVLVPIAVQTDASGQAPADVRLEASNSVQNPEIRAELPASRAAD